MSDERNDRLYETAQGMVEIGPIRESDIPSAVDLFRIVFGKEKSEAYFRWQVFGNTVGVHFDVGRDEQGRVVSQFGGIPINVKVYDREVVFGQIIDTIVHPDHRAGLKRKGLYAATVDAYVERFGHRDQELIMYGLTNEQHFRIGRRMAGYVPMGRAYMLTKEIEPRPGTVDLPRVEERKGRRFLIQAVDRFGDDVDQLWLRLRHHHDVITVRDARTMNWRYADCPITDRYVRLELRDESTGEILGIAAGVFGYEDAPDGVIAEWFVDPEVEGARAVFLRNIEEMMAAVSMRRVLTYLNPVHEESRFFEDAGYWLTKTESRLVSRTYDSDIVTPARLARDWYYTFGDFDSI